MCDEEVAAIQDVLLVEEVRAAPAIALALRPLVVSVAHDVTEAAEMLHATSFRAVLVAADFGPQFGRDMPRITLVPPTEYGGEVRRRILRKPFGQPQLGAQLAKTWDGPLVLQPLMQQPRRRAVGGKVMRIGPRALGIAQVQTHWGWSDAQTVAFRYYLSLPNVRELADRLGYTLAGVNSVLKRATTKARLALGIQHLAPSELRIWLLNRVTEPH